jgi:serine/threonine protein phosphatase PrpC
VTDKGHRHPRNEDAFYLDVVDGGAVAVVCDGVSTTAESERASQAAADAAGHLLAAALGDRPDQLEAATKDAIAAAQSAVLELPEAAQDDTAPATTLVSAVCHHGEVTVGWVGDSRAYWVAQTEAQQLTVDDSWAEQQVQSGSMSLQLAEADPRSHGITRWLGAGAPEGGPQLRTFQPAEPGRLLLCTDGLWNYTTTTEEIQALVAGQPPGTPALDLARRLTNFALNAGGHDNITVVIVDLPEGSRGAAST